MCAKLNILVVNRFEMESSVMTPKKVDLDEYLANA